MKTLETGLGIAYTLVILGCIVALVFALVADLTGWWDKKP